VRIRRDGYSVRLTFAEFLQAYQIVRFPATEPVPAKDAKDACGEVLKWAATRRALPEDSWQLGKSKVVAHPPSLSLSVPLLAYRPRLFPTHRCAATALSRRSMITLLIVNHVCLCDLRFEFTRAEAAL